MIGQALLSTNLNTQQSHWPWWFCGIVLASEARGCVGSNPSRGGGIFLLSTEWVDYVEEPMKYQALRPHLFSVGGWGWWSGWWGGGGFCQGGGGGGVRWVDGGVCGVLVRDVVGGG